MHIYINAPIYHVAETDEELEVFKEKLHQELNKLGSIKRFEEADLGGGADWPVILIELDWFAAAAALFLLGDQIKSNIDAWKKLGERFSKLLSSMRSYGHEPIITIEAACLLALKHATDIEDELEEFVIDVIVASESHGGTHTVYESSETVSTESYGPMEFFTDMRSGLQHYTVFLRCDGWKPFIVGFNRAGDIKFSLRV